MTRRIALTGTPGTGKTAVADRLDDRRVIHLNDFASKHGLVGDDGEVDVRLLNTYLDNELADATGTVVFEGHFAHDLSELDVVIVLRCAPSRLATRLSERDWSKEKLRENMEAEAMGLIAAEARSRAPWVYEIETSDRELDEVVETVQAIIEDPTQERFEDLEVGWVDHLDEVLDWY